MKQFINTTILILLLFSTSFADVAVTVYNQDLGLIREQREVEFPKGVGEVRFVDVASQIIPTSVHFSSPNAALLGQNYEYDLIDSDKLLRKYLDNKVKLISEDGETFIGLLLSASGDIVLREDDGSIRSLARGRIVNILFPDLPEGLITRPTLVWLVDSKNGGKNDAEISYLTEGMSWETEYVAVTDEKDESIELTGWVNITNHSGATYKDARIKLMAGDVQIIKSRKKRGWSGGEMPSVTAMSVDGGRGFEEQPFYEYHLYTLQRPSTLSQNQVKQISLFPTASVQTVEKEYRLDMSRNNSKVKVTLIFENLEKNGLGIPLPKGIVRVYKEGPDKGLEFIGEDRIDHTPKDEEVKIVTGNAFDIVGEKLHTDEERRGNSRENEYVIRVRNHKNEPVKVTVSESVRGGDWQMMHATEGWEKVSANQVEWKVSLKPDEEKVITYRVLTNR